MSYSQVIAMRSPMKSMASLSLFSMHGLDVPELHEYTAFNMLQISMLEKSLPNAELTEELLKLPPISDPAYFETNEDGEAPYMMETRHRWLRQLLLEQAEIHTEVDEEVRQFDKAVEKLQVRRFHVKLDAEFMNAYMNSLNQELYILRDSEEIETQLLLNAKTAMSTRNELQVVINTTNRQLDELRRNIDKLGEQIIAVQVLFSTTVKGHKFFDFLTDAGNGYGPGVPRTKSYRALYARLWWRD